MFDMLANAVKNLFTKPATRMYPDYRRECFKGARGHLEINFENCIFCGICSRRCPADAINVSKSDRSWEVDPFKCIVCGACTEVCPKKCLSMEQAHLTPAYDKRRVLHVRKLEGAGDGRLAQNL